MGMCGDEKGPSKVDGHLSQLIDGKLTYILCGSGDIIFWLRDQIAKLKTCQIQKKIQHLG